MNKSQLQIYFITSNIHCNAIKPLEGMFFTNMLTKKIYEANSTHHHSFFSICKSSPDKIF